MKPKAVHRPARRTERPAEPDLETGPETTGSVVAQNDAAQADDELAELSNQVADGAMYSLYRLLDGGDKEFVDEQAVAGFSVGAIARRFGGGRYVMYLRKPDPDIAGKSIRQGSKRFSIGGAPKYPVDDAGADSPAVAGVADVARLSQTYGDLIQQGVKNSLEQAQLVQTMQTAVIANLTNRPPDPTMELLKLLLPALLGGRKDQLTVADVIALADKMSNRTSPTSQLKDTLELVTIARELGEGGEKGPAWLSVADRALGLVGRFVPDNPPALTAGATDTPPAADPSARPATTQPEEPAVPESAHPLLKWLAPQMPGLVRHAQAGHDPDTYAGVIFDLIPSSYWKDVKALLTAPTFLEQLQSAFPMMMTVREWFGELAECIVERIDEQHNPTGAGELEPPAM